MLLQDVTLPTRLPASNLPIPAPMQKAKTRLTYEDRPHHFHLPADTSGQAPVKRRKIQKSSTLTSATVPKIAPGEVPAPPPIPLHLPLPPVTLPGVPGHAQTLPYIPQTSQQQIIVVEDIPLTSNAGMSNTTKWRHAKRLAEGKELKFREKTYNRCSKCGQPKSKAYGHSQYKGYVYCPNSCELTLEEWRRQYM